MMQGMTYTAIQENLHRDFGQKYKMPTIRLEDDAVQLLLKYRWPGKNQKNQTVKNIAEQVFLS